MCAAWQSRAKAVAVEAERALWAPCGARALAYLRGRGFTDDTIRGARLGYVPKDLREAFEAWGLPANHRPVWVAARRHDPVARLRRYVAPERPSPYRHASAPGFCPRRRLTPLPTFGR